MQDLSHLQFWVIFPFKNLSMGTPVLILMFAKKVGNCPFNAFK